MAWNPSPKVALARDYGKKFNRDKVIIIAVNEASGQFEVISYGETKKKCGEARIIADNIFEMVKDSRIKF
jgi:hypothetical protein